MIKTYNKISNVKYVSDSNTSQIGKIERQTAKLSKNYDSNSYVTSNTNIDLQCQYLPGFKDIRKSFFINFCST